MKKNLSVPQENELLLQLKLLQNYINHNLHYTEKNIINPLS